jgi:hypothetical protein
LIEDSPAESGVPAYKQEQPPETPAEPAGLLGMEGSNS